MTDQTQTYQIRNKHYNQFGTIDMEWFHPVLQRWIEYTADPNDLTDYAAAIHAQALAEGDIGPYVPPSLNEQRALLPVLSPRKFREALIDESINLASVDAAIAAMAEGPEKEKAKVAWEYADYFSRVDPVLQMICVALGLTDEQVDEMWLRAVSSQ